MPDRPRPALATPDLMRAGVVAAAVLAIPMASTNGRDELVFLALLAAPALAATAAIALRPAIELALGSLLAVLAAWSLPASPTRAAVIVAILAAAPAAAMARRGARVGVAATVLLAIAFQTLARGALLVEPGMSAGRAAVVFGLEPLAAGVATAILSARWGQWGWVTVALLFALQGGLHLANTAVLVALGGIAWLGRQRPWGRLPRFLGAGTMLLVTATAVVAAYPWLRSSPLRTVIALPAQAIGAAGTRSLLEGGELVLDATHPQWRADLDQTATQIVVVSSLANAAGLTRDTEVLVIEWTAEDGTPGRWPLRTGADTGEWAARRPDVAAQQPAVPVAWQSLLVDGFFAQRYRVTHALPVGTRLRQISLSRGAGLPAEATAAVFSLEVN